MSGIGFLCHSSIPKRRAMITWLRFSPSLGKCVCPQAKAKRSRRRLLTFRALHFGHAECFSISDLKSHSRYAEWLAIAGTDWNLYIATHEMSFSTQSQRQAAERDAARDYRPEFSPAVSNPELPGLRTLLLARAMRTDLQE